MPQFERLQLDSQNSTSLKTRTILWNVGLKMGFERPLTGAGHDRIEENIEPFLPKQLQSNPVFYVDRTHSEITDIFAMHGIFTLIGYVGLLLIVWTKSIRIFSRRTSTEADAIGAAFVGFTALTLFHIVNFSTISSWVLLAVLVGFLTFTALEKERA